MTLFCAYLRQSTIKQQISGLGIAAQLESVERYVRDNRGTLVCEPFVETESGRKCDRPQLAAAMAKCRETGAVLVIAKLDRLSRDLLFIATMMRGDVRFVACDNPAANELTTGIMAVMAQHEAKLCSDRTKAAMAAARARGVVLGGFRGRHLSEAERDAGRAKANAARSRAARAQAVSMKPILDAVRAAGATTLRDLASALNARGLPAPRGGAWAPAQVRRLMLVAE